MLPPAPPALLDLRAQQQDLLGARHRAADIEAGRPLLQGRLPHVDADLERRARRGRSDHGLLHLGLGNNRVISGIWNRTSASDGCEPSATPPFDHPIDAIPMKVS